MALLLLCSIGNNRRMKKLSRRLKELRAKRGLTQAALANRAGVTLSYIGRLEIGRHDPQLSTLYRIAKALNISVGDLVD